MSKHVRVRRGMQWGVAAVIAALVAVLAISTSFVPSAGATGNGEVGVGSTVVRLF